MPRLPKDLSGRQVARALERVGFVLTRQRASHMILYRAEPKARVVVPDHRVLREGTLRQIVADAGLSVGSFLRLL